MSAISGLLLRSQLSQTAASTAMSAVTSAGQGIVASWIGDFTRAGNYLANRHNRDTLLPSPGDLIRAQCRGRMTLDTVFDVAANYAIGGEATRAIWEATIKAGWTVPSIEMTIRAAYRDEWPAHLLADRLKLNGVNDYVESWTRAPYPWTPDQARTLLNIGAIDINQYGPLLDSTGMYRSDDRRLFHQLHVAPSPPVILDMRNRGVVPDDDIARKYLYLSGFNHRDEADRMLRMRYYIPGPSDQIRFGIREAWNQQVVERFGYDAEYRDIPQLRYFSSLVGLDFDPAWPEAMRAGMVGWDQVYWRSHWEVVSPTQAYLCQQRFRPNRGPTGRTDPERDLVWTQQDTETILKVHDYAPGMRKYLSALAYQPLRLVDIRSVVRELIADPDHMGELIGQAWVARYITEGSYGPPEAWHEVAKALARDWAADKHQDRGSTAGDAAVLAELDVRRAIASQRRLAGRHRDLELLRRREVSAALAAYQAGTIDRATATAQLTRAHAVDPARQLAVVDERIKSTRAKTVVTGVRNLYLSGQVDGPGAKQLLEQAGFVGDAADRYTTLWQIQREAQRHHWTEREIMNDYRDLTLTYNQAVSRLANIGWTRKKARALLDSVLPPPTLE